MAKPCIFLLLFLILASACQKDKKDEVAGPVKVYCDFKEEITTPIENKLKSFKGDTKNLYLNITVADPDNEGYEMGLYYCDSCTDGYAIRTTNRFVKLKNIDLPFITSGDRFTKRPPPYDELRNYTYHSSGCMMKIWFGLGQDDIKVEENPLRDI